MDAIVRMICEHCVDTPSALKIDVSKDSRGTFYVVSPLPEEVGQLLGKNGDLIRGIRVVLRAIATAQHFDKIFIDVPNFNSTKGP